jgi:prevent-host-death family protein
MLDITKDIQSLTSFRRSSGDFMKQLKKTKRPVVLTVNGKAAAVVQDAEAYQRLLDIAARADAEEGIRQGLDDVAHGRTRPVREFFDELKPRMAYLVNITVRAEGDFDRLYRQIRAEESDAALKWYRGLKEAVLSLGELPNRCPQPGGTAKPMPPAWGNCQTDAP